MSPWGQQLKVEAVPMPLIIRAWTLAQAGPEGAPGSVRVSAFLIQSLGFQAIAVASWPDAQLELLSIEQRSGDMAHKQGDAGGLCSQGSSGHGWLRSYPEELSQRTEHDAVAAGNVLAPRALPAAEAAALASKAVGWCFWSSRIVCRERHVGLYVGWRFTLGFHCLALPPALYPHMLSPAAFRVQEKAGASVAWLSYGLGRFNVSDFGCSAASCAPHHIQGLLCFAG